MIPTRSGSNMIPLTPRVKKEVPTARGSGNAPTATSSTPRIKLERTASATRKQLLLSDSAATLPAAVSTSSSNTHLSPNEFPVEWNIIEDEMTDVTKKTTNDHTTASKQMAYKRVTSSSNGVESVDVSKRAVEGVTTTAAAAANSSKSSLVCPVRGCHARYVNRKSLQKHMLALHRSAKATRDLAAQLPLTVTGRKKRTMTTTSESPIKSTTITTTPTGTPRRSGRQSPRKKLTAAAAVAPTEPAMSQSTAETDSSDSDDDSDSESDEAGAAAPLLDLPRECYPPAGRIFPEYALTAAFPPQARDGLHPLLQLLTKSFATYFSTPTIHIGDTFTVDEIFVHYLLFKYDPKFLLDRLTFQQLVTRSLWIRGGLERWSRNWKRLTSNGTVAAAAATTIDSPIRSRPQRAASRTSTSTAIVDGDESDEEIWWQNFTLSRRYPARVLLNRISSFLDVTFKHGEGKSVPIGEQQAKIQLLKEMQRWCQSLPPAPLIPIIRPPQRDASVTKNPDQSTNPKTSVALPSTPPPDSDAALTTWNKSSLEQLNSLLLANDGRVDRNLTLRQIADTLGKSIDTVRTQVAQIRKLKEIQEAKEHERMEQEKHQANLEKMMQRGTKKTANSKKKATTHSSPAPSTTPAVSTSSSSHNLLHFGDVSHLDTSLVPSIGNRGRKRKAKGFAELQLEFQAATVAAAANTTTSSTSTSRSKPSNAPPSPLYPYPSPTTTKKDVKSSPTKKKPPSKQAIKTSSMQPSSTDTSSSSESEDESSPTVKVAVPTAKRPRMTKKKTSLDSSASANPTATTPTTSAPPIPSPHSLPIPPPYGHYHPYAPYGYPPYGYPPMMPPPPPPPAAVAASTTNSSSQKQRSKPSPTNATSNTPIPSPPSAYPLPYPYPYPGPHSYPTAVGNGPTPGYPPSHHPPPPYYPGYPPPTDAYGRPMQWVLMPVQTPPHATNQPMDEDEED